MGRCDNACHFFHLNGFQIGDLQSYLSDLSLFLAPESKTFYILVDNRPWLEDLVSGPAHLWQLMITKSRLSPFAITKGPQKENKEDPETSKHSQKLKRWLSMVTLSRKRVLLPVKKLRTSLLANGKLHRTLYGFIVFKVAWKDVRGINYLNELQTDTSLAIEAKDMRRWEFDSIAQAANSTTSWFLGTPYERLLLENHLNSMTGDAFHEAGMDTPSTCGSSTDLDENDDKIVNSGMLSSHESSHNLNDQLETLQEDVDQTSIDNTTLINSPDNYDIDNELNTEASSPCPSECSEATQYTDVLLLFRFNDCHLPFKLQKIIMSDLRLLTLLEAGLPSWVIFFQSYPVFCHVYRPWMCPLARTLYVAISFVTVLIGFYDLYKNIPVLKAMASRLFGPLFDWIETWEMVSRIKYLGTMLFLHNAEKAVMWFLMVSRTVRSIVSVLTQPLVAPLMVVLDGLFPFWNVFIEIGDHLYSCIFVLVGTCWSLLDNVMDTLLLPVWYISSLICNFATGVMGPILLCVWKAICAPIQVVFELSKFLGYIYKYTYESLEGIWLFVRSILKVASNAEAAATHTYEVSMWRALWSDLFSKVFRAVKSILYGVVAFFAACNRHRLSIYNHLREFIQRLHQPAQPLISNNKLQKNGNRTPPSEPRELRSLPTKITKQS